MDYDGNIIRHNSRRSRKTDVTVNETFEDEPIEKKELERNDLVHDTNTQRPLNQRQLTNAELTEIVFNDSADEEEKKVEEEEKRRQYLLKKRKEDEQKVKEEFKQMEEQKKIKEAIERKKRKRKLERKPISSSSSLSSITITNRSKIQKLKKPIEDVIVVPDSPEPQEKRKFPPSSNDLYCRNEDLLTFLEIYEVLRKFSRILQIERFPFEYFLYILSADYRIDYLEHEIFISLLRLLLSEDEKSNLSFTSADSRVSYELMNAFSSDYLLWPYVLQNYIESMSVTYLSIETVSEIDDNQIEMEEKIEKKFLHEMFGKDLMDYQLNYSEEDGPNFKRSQQLQQIVEDTVNHIEFSKNDPQFMKVFRIVNKKDFPFITMEEKLELFKFLTSIIQRTDIIREELNNKIETNLIYKKKCFKCEGILIVDESLPCELCSNIIHHQCSSDNELVNQNEKKWICAECRSKQIICIDDYNSMNEKFYWEGKTRHDVLGVDNENRHYWWLCRRIVVSEYDEKNMKFINTKYYSTIHQFQELLSCLEEMEEKNDSTNQLIEMLENNRSLIEESMRKTIEFARQRNDGQYPKIELVELDENCKKDNRLTEITYPNNVISQSGGVASLFQKRIEKDVPDDVDDSVMRNFSHITDEEEENGEMMMENINFVEEDLKLTQLDGMDWSINQMTGMNEKQGEIKRTEYLTKYYGFIGREKKIGKKEEVENDRNYLNNLKSNQLPLFRQTINLGKNLNNKNRLNLLINQSKSNEVKEKDELMKEKSFNVDEMNEELEKIDNDFGRFVNGNFKIKIDNNLKNLLRRTDELLMSMNIDDPNIKYSLGYTSNRLAGPASKQRTMISLSPVVDGVVVMRRANEMLMNNQWRKRKNVIEILRFPIEEKSFRKMNSTNEYRLLISDGNEMCTKYFENISKRRMTTDYYSDKNSYNRYLQSKNIITKQLTGSALCLDEKKMIPLSEITDDDCLIENDRNEIRYETPSFYWKTRNENLIPFITLSDHRQIVINTLLHIESSIPSEFLHFHWKSNYHMKWKEYLRISVKDSNFLSRLILLFVNSMKPCLFTSAWYDSTNNIRLFREMQIREDGTTSTTSLTSNTISNNVSTTIPEDDEMQEGDAKKNLGVGSATIAAASTTLPLSMATYDKHKSIYLHLFDETSNEKGRRCRIDKIFHAHHLWKSRGEEYRMYGNGGWSWTSITRIDESQRDYPIEYVKRSLFSTLSSSTTSTTSLSSIRVDNESLGKYLKEMDEIDNSTNSREMVMRMKVEELKEDEYEIFLNEEHFVLNGRASIFLISPRQLQILCKQSSWKLETINGFRSESRVIPYGHWPYHCGKPTFAYHFRYSLITDPTVKSIAFHLRVLFSLIRWSEIAECSFDNIGHRTINIDKNKTVIHEIVEGRNMGIHELESMYRIRVYEEVHKTVFEEKSGRGYREAAKQGVAALTATFKEMIKETPDDEIIASINQAEKMKEEKLNKVKEIKKNIIKKELIDRSQFHNEYNCYSYWTSEDQMKLWQVKWAERILFKRHDLSPTTNDNVFPSKDLYPIYKDQMTIKLKNYSHQNQTDQSHHHQKEDNHRSHNHHHHHHHHHRRKSDKKNHDKVKKRNKERHHRRHRVDKQKTNNNQNPPEIVVEEKTKMKKEKEEISSKTELKINRIEKKDSSMITKFDQEMIVLEDDNDGDIENEVVILDDVEDIYIEMKDNAKQPKNENKIKISHIILPNKKQENSKKIQKVERINILEEKKKSEEKYRLEIVKRKRMMIESIELRRNELGEIKLKIHNEQKYRIIAVIPNFLRESRDRINEEEEERMKVEKIIKDSENCLINAFDVDYINYICDLNERLIAVFDFNTQMVDACGLDNKTEMLLKLDEHYLGVVRVDDCSQNIFAPILLPVPQEKDLDKWVKESEYEYYSRWEQKLTGQRMTPIEHEFWIVNNRYETIYEENLQKGNEEIPSFVIDVQIGDVVEDLVDTLCNINEIDDDEEDVVNRYRLRLIESEISRRRTWKKLQDFRMNKLREQHQQQNHQDEIINEIYDEGNDIEQNHMINQTNEVDILLSPLYSKENVKNNSGNLENISNEQENSNRMNLGQIRNNFDEDFHESIINSDNDIIIKESKGKSFENDEKWNELETNHITTTKKKRKKDVELIPLKRHDDHPTYYNHPSPSHNLNQNTSRHYFDNIRQTSSSRRKRKEENLRLQMMEKIPPFGQMPQDIKVLYPLASDRVEILAKSIFQLKQIIITRRAQLRERLNNEIKYELNGHILPQSNSSVVQSNERSIKQIASSKPVKTVNNSSSLTSIGKGRKTKQIVNDQRQMADCPRNDYNQQTLLQQIPSQSYNDPSREYHQTNSIVNDLRNNFNCYCGSVYDKSKAIICCHRCRRAFHAACIPSQNLKDITQFFCNNCQELLKEMEEPSSNGHYQSSVDCIYQLSPASATHSNSSHLFRNSSNMASLTNVTNEQLIRSNYLEKNQIVNQYSHSPQLNSPYHRGNDNYNSYQQPQRAHNTYLSQQNSSYSHQSHGHQRMNYSNYSIRPRSEPIVSSCFCRKNIPSKPLIQCQGCRRYSHSECVGIHPQSQQHFICEMCRR
ncbi:hypothetical protein SNEBB_009312 [Seison nebaliae]|nr:hypothetical protein SNEBB_009312 [Seison nebaliae]